MCPFFKQIFSNDVLRGQVHKIPAIYLGCISQIDIENLFFWASSPR